MPGKALTDQLNNAQEKRPPKRSIGFLFKTSSNYTEPMGKNYDVFCRTIYINELFNIFPSGTDIMPNLITIAKRFGVPLSRLKKNYKSEYKILVAQSLKITTNKQL